MAWPNANLPSLSKTILITGANTGLGFHAARLLAAQNARVIMACRSESKMAAAASAIRSEAPDANLIQLPLDLADLDDVRAFAHRFKALDIPTLDVLILNAGVAVLDYRESKQGYEQMFAVNHLGHFVLTALLLPYMKDVEGSRIVSVTSLAHLRAVGVDIDMVNGKGKEGFQCMTRYRESKLANVWFTFALQRRLEAAGAKTVAVAAHPGVSKTDLMRHAGQSWLISLFLSFLLMLGQSAEEGCWSLVLAAVDERKGEVYGPDGFYELRGCPKAGGRTSALARDVGKQEWFWGVSEEMAGLKFEV